EFRLDAAPNEVQGGHQALLDPAGEGHLSECRSSVCSPQTADLRAGWPSPASLWICARAQRSDPFRVDPPAFQDVPGLSFRASSCTCSHWEVQMSAQLARCWPLPYALLHYALLHSAGHLESR